MLVKLAFVMQRLKKYLKNFCHDRQRWGGHRAHGSPPVPPTRENPGTCIQLRMTKHPSRKVMNFRHLLGCDTIDEN